jgi:hypothetical protein
MDPVRTARAVEAGFQVLEYPVFGTFYGGHGCFYRLRCDVIVTSLMMAGARSLGT